MNILHPEELARATTILLASVNIRCLSLTEHVVLPDFPDFSFITYDPDKDRSSFTFHNFPSRNEKDDVTLLVTQESKFEPAITDKIFTIIFESVVKREKALLPFTAKSWTREILSEEGYNNQIKKAIEIIKENTIIEPSNKDYHHLLVNLLKRFGILSSIRIHVEHEDEYFFRIFTTPTGFKIVKKIRLKNRHSDSLVLVLKDDKKKKSHQKIISCGEERINYFYLLDYTFNYIKKHPFFQELLFDFPSVESYIESFTQQNNQ